jgi:LmbE family N-acetylglucosaminyl deacetylase
MKSKLLVALLSVAATAIPSVVYAENSVATPLPQNLIFVSPHADDIALTFGGLINNEKGLSDKNNTTMLIFSQSQWTENDNAKDLSPQRISKVSQMRLNEDQAALDNLFNFNYRMETYGYPDAPIRHYEGPKTAGGGPGGNFSTFGTPEKQVYQDLVPMFENKLKTPNCAMFVLMANGYHVDHFIVREAVITAARNLGKKAQCQKISHILEHSQISLRLKWETLLNV